MTAWRDPCDVAARAYSVGPTRVREWHSLADLLSLRPSPVNAATANERSRAHEDEARAWYGTDSRARACAILAGEPWPEGLEHIARARAALPEIPRPVSLRRRPRWDTDGDEVDLDRVREGRLDAAWRTCRREAQPGGAPTVAILTDVAVGAGVRAETVALRGAATVALADALETAGYTVELWGAAFSVGVYPNSAACDRADLFPLKGAGEPLDCVRLAAWAVLAAGFRIPLFAARWAERHKTAENLGTHTEELPERIHAGVWPDAPQRLFFAPGPRTGESGPVFRARIADWIIETITTIGGNDNAHTETLSRVP